METLFANAYLRVYLHRTTHLTLELQWLDFVPSTPFRAALQEIWRLLGEHRIKAMVADNRLLRAVRPADLTLAGELVMQRLSDLGGQRFAPIESLDAMNRMGVTALIASVIPNTHLTSQYFATIEDARTRAENPISIRLSQPAIDSTSPISTPSPMRRLP